MGNDLATTLMLLPTLLQSMMQPLNSLISSTTGTDSSTTASDDTEYSTAVQMLAYDTADIIDLSSQEVARYQQVVEEHEAEAARAAQVQESETAIGSIVDSAVDIVTLLDDLGVINLPETRDGTTASTWLSAIVDTLTNTGFAIYDAWGGKNSEDSEEGKSAEYKTPSDVKYSSILGVNNLGISQDAWNNAGLDPSAFASFDTNGDGRVSLLEYVQGGGQR